ncbi:hypothetical protein NG798_08840 [Ancylothrix sp. C2]|nr:hypothetical protein [Ancylothrix sp. D3o]MCT7949891.1 hypothetical protein [Ancylothrix sp. D3o]
MSNQEENFISANIQHKNAADIVSNITLIVLEKILKKGESKKVSLPIY